MRVGRSWDGAEALGPGWGPSQALPPHCPKVPASTGLSEDQLPSLRADAVLGLAGVACESCVIFTIPEIYSLEKRCCFRVG